jgi:hypothetical protein
MKKSFPSLLVAVGTFVGVWWLLGRFQFSSATYGLVVIAVFVVSPYVVGPLVIRFAHRQSTHPQLVPKRPEELPREATVFIVEMANALTAEGFTQWPMFAFGSDKAMIYLKYFVNRTTGDAAMSVVVQAGAGNIRRIRDKHVAFATKLVDSFEVRTTNSATIGVLPPSPGRDGVQLLGVADPRRLYQIHVARVRRLAGGRAPVLPAEGQEIATVTAEIMHDLDRQVEVGYFYRDAGGEFYRPTWKGAALMTWKLCWPVKQIRRARIVRRGNEALRQLGLAG